MKTRILKEIRAQLPVWILAGGLSVVMWLQFFNGTVDWGRWISWLTFSCLLTGAVTFGHEFHHRTMPLLLAQPEARWLIWREKMSVLGVGLAVIFVLNCPPLWWNAPDSNEAAAFVWLIPVVAFGTAPFWTLVARTALGGMLFTLMVPPMAVGSVALVGELLSPGVFHEPAYDGVVACLIQGGLLAYALLLHRWGWLMFNRWDAAREVSQEVQLPRKMGTFFTDCFEHCWPGRPGVFGTLVRKEIRLHKLALVMTGGICAACSAFGLIKFAGGFEWAENTIIVTIGIYIVALPMVLGAVSTAEERNLGVLESQLMLPVAVRWQWVVKCLTTVGLCLLLGVALPKLIILLTRVPIELAFLQAIQLRSFGGVAGGELLLLALAMYASTLSPNAIRGMLMGVGLWAAVWSLCRLIANQSAGWMQQFRFGPSSVETYIQLFNLIPVIEMVGAYVLGVLVFRFAYANYRMPEFNIRRLLAHGMAAVCAVVLWVVPQVVIMNMRHPMVP